MISRYKLKVISWYTMLLALILILFVALLFGMLQHQLRAEINENLSKKIEWITSILLDSEEPPAPRRGFLDFIVARRHYNFYDIMEHTDISDDKYLLLVYCGEKLMYLSETYQSLESSLKPFQFDGSTTPKISLSGAHFAMSAIYKNGYTLYLGYDLSTIYSLRRRVTHIFLLFLPFGIALSILCGYVVTQRSLKVINAVNQIAARITSKNLHERIRVPEWKDEITNLIVTLNSMIDRLENSFAIAQQFSHDAAHEMRTPLTVIRGVIEDLLKDENCPERIAAELECILDETQYLTSITNNLLLIHTLDTGQIEYNFTTIDLAKIISEILEDAKVLSSAKGHSIDLENCESIKIKGNEELLLRLLWNIIDNSVKYTPAGGKISISLRQDKSAAIINVGDNGIGIPDEEIPKIFNRFYRVDKSRSRKLGGSGLGLAICKWIVELHHGEIEVRSKVKVGTDITITIPIDIIP